MREDIPEDSKGDCLKPLGFFKCSRRTHTANCQILCKIFLSVNLIGVKLGRREAYGRSAERYGRTATATMDPGFFM